MKHGTAKADLSSPVKCAFTSCGASVLKVLLRGLSANAAFLADLIVLQAIHLLATGVHDS